LNGVKLASADYTATNGSDVVLASGAATGDILEVVAFTTFTPADLPEGTPSIDDNGTGTRMTIGSGSDNAVMVGTTISNPVSNNVQGISFRGAYGEVQISSEGSSGAPLYLNRKSSDGVIEVFRKDGNDVGSIGVSSDGASFGNATQHVAMHSGKLFPASPTHSTLDNTIDLGYSAGRYKDLYLSGGVYLGGTGSANKLEDYEEGSWTPTATNGGSFSNSAYGSYTKIGNVVTLHATLIVSSNSSGLGFGITSLPFAQSSSNTEAAAGFYMRYTTDSTLRMVYLSNGSVISVYNIGGGATTFGTASTKRYDFSGVYYTDA